jgi:hypothetical protein
MISLAGEFARVLKKDRGGLAHPFQNEVVFDNSLSRETAKERHRG